MLTRNVGDGRCVMHCFFLPLTMLLLLQAFASCSTDAHTTSLPSAPTASQTQPVPTSAPPVPTSTLQPSALHGPTNFLLATPLNFSSADGATKDNNGAITPLAANAIKTEITGELKRLLFVVDNSDLVKVYSPGASPITAQVALHTDGGTAIDYTQVVNSEAGSVTITFNGVLLKDQMTATYQQQYAPSILINASESAVVVAFTTQVRWIEAKQIPAAPGHGQYQRTSNGGVALSWSAGQNATAYNVYRLISDHDQQFQLLATVKNTSYIDDSAEAIHDVNLTKGITYAIFSLGPTGVENPGGIIIAASQ
ncbi:hypothetical protein KSD_61310 [Ktedonobacter sp. SOSP1-85]|uniref:hypothetical protein n=1 Tax=Ktedonobacter sp. SOSP1-85 TaxID=2778367 RepID=UPI0019157B97|nr:hypothetical protein [Ktedonobacter sp. SOSP1-85]GHO78360.1 hypothetical protein KSD_61310 [Ktedonobacter sp. SOSP1-85]